MDGTTLIIAGNGVGSILANEDSYCVFYNFTSVPSISGLDIDTSNAVDMSYAFCGCSALTGLDLNSWNVENVEDINSIFYKCSSLESRSVSSWDTSKVKDMSYIFERCSDLPNLENIY